MMCRVLDLVPIVIKPSASSACQSRHRPLLAGYPIKCGGLAEVNACTPNEF